MLKPFSFTGMPGLLFGPGRVAELGARTAAWGRHALLLTGAGSLARSGHLARIIDGLAASGVHVHHQSVAGEPSPEMVDGVVAEMKSSGVEVVVAVGGGSVIDTGKAVAAMLAEGGSVLDVLEGVGRRQPSGRTLPVIAVPTTSGTGSEATKNAVISRIGADGFKKSLRHSNFVPRLAILDAELCLSAPPAVTAACGMDALTQLIEAYVSTQASPLTDALALDGLQRLVPALPEACGQGASDPGCRGAVAYGAFLSGVTLAHAGLGVVHGVAGPMGGLIDIPHGVACANLLPPAVETTIDSLKIRDTADARRSIAKYARLGELFGAPPGDAGERCRHLVDCLYGWLASLSIPRLSRFGLNPQLIARLVGLAGNKSNPLPLSTGQIEQMLLKRC